MRKFFPEKARAAPARRHEACRGRAARQCESREKRHATRGFRRILSEVEIPPVESRRIAARARLETMRRVAIQRFMHGRLPRRMNRVMLHCVFGATQRSVRDSPRLILTRDFV
jgi:hypothetical protein